MSTRDYAMFLIMPIFIAGLRVFFDKETPLLDMNNNPIPIDKADKFRLLPSIFFIFATIGIIILYII